MKSNDAENKPPTYSRESFEDSLNFFRELSHRLNNFFQCLVSKNLTQHDYS